MQKTSYLKKNCFLCNKITLCSLESKVIKSQIKCNVYKCQKCSLVFLDKKFVNRKLKKIIMKIPTFINMTKILKKILTIFIKKFTMLLKLLQKT